VTRLEDELRAVFAARVAQLPLPPDLAGQAIRHAARLRRRQAALVGLAGFVAVALVAAGVLHGSWPRTRAKQTTFAAEPSQLVRAAVLGIRLDLRVGNTLWTADGRRLPLPGVGAVTWVYRVPAGWVYSGTAGTLRMLLADGAPADLAQPADAAVVSTDGQRIAWSTGLSGGEVMMVGRLTGRGLSIEGKTGVPEPAKPVAVLGSTVLVRRSDDAGAVDAYDLWYPTKEFRPSWKMALAGVYGGGDGSLLGLAYQKAVGGVVPCLSRFEVADDQTLRATSSPSCGLALVPGGADGSASPDGQWLVADAPNGVMFVSLTALASPAKRPAADATASAAATAAGTTSADDASVGDASATAPASPRATPVDAGGALAATAPDPTAPDPTAPDPTAPRDVLPSDVAPSPSEGADSGRFTADAGGPVTRTCAIRGRSAPAWEDPQSVLVATDTGLVRCGLDGTYQRIPVAGLPAADWSVVPALGTW
jgi:hypothetical protein